MRQPVAEVDIFTSPDEPATDEKADLQRPKRARQERPSRAKPNPGEPKTARQGPPGQDVRLACASA